MICESTAITCINHSRHHSRHTAISGKVVGKKCSRQTRKVLWVVLSSLLFKRRAREAMDVCLRVLKESNKSRFDSYSVRNSVLIISHITFRDCRVHMFSDNLSRNSCIRCLIRGNSRHHIYQRRSQGISTIFASPMLSIIGLGTVKLLVKSPFH